ncbi:MAG: four helix bundle protein [Gemmatimonadales bacterium]
MGDFRRLDVWQRARGLSLEVYLATRSMPRSELFGLTSQLRRSAISIAANIAEGCGRNTDPELRRFLRIALGSAAELECLLWLAADAGYVVPAEAFRLANEAARLCRMLATLIRKLPDNR